MSINTAALSQRRRTLQILAVLYVMLLTYLLVVPAPLQPLGEEGLAAEDTIDNTVSGFVQHVGAYGVLLWLLVIGFGPSSRRRVFWCACSAFGHGVLTECVQYFVPRRHLDWKDIAANALGIVLAGGVLALHRIHQCRRRSLAGVQQGNIESEQADLASRCSQARA